jgi:hypothetical protein
MNWWGSGFITMINYASGAAIAPEENNAILTEDSNEILTESSQPLLA